MQRATVSAARALGSRHARGAKKADAAEADGSVPSHTGNVGCGAPIECGAAPLSSTMRLRSPDKHAADGQVVTLEWSA